MLEIIGDGGTSEYAAAKAIAMALGELWPGIENSSPSQEFVRIAASAKISGYRVSDIDVVVAAVFKDTRRFIPRKVVRDMKGNRVVKKPIAVTNMVLVVEVKDHGETGVRISGDNISVKYSRGAQVGWKSATDQNINQVHSLRHYAKDLGCEVYVHRCVMMRGLTALRVAGAVGAGFNGVDLLTAAASVSKVNYSSLGYTLSSGATVDMQRFLRAPIFKRMTPTSLDRYRMDMVTNGTCESQELFEYLGKKMVRLRGHGGSGKTVMLLQVAWKAFDKHGARTLVLTYNHALAADIRRLMALLKVPSSPENGGIKVSTVMSFMYSWFSKFQLLENEEELSFEKYEKTCNLALELLEGGALSGGDIKKIIQSAPDRYDFDHVVVDEAQDWPQPEADLLKLLYHPRKIAVADGIDQLLRGKRTQWEQGVDEADRHIIPLIRCLRMKRNLAVFVNQVAREGGVKWEALPNDIAGGGRVIILSGDYGIYERLHGELIAAAKEKGNAELDFLFCVPPSDVVMKKGRKESHIGRYLLNRGYQVWDGVDEIARTDFPRSRKQYRVVQYASCRGLEGWTVVLNKADQFWEQCRENRRAIGLSKEEELAFEDLDELSTREAWNKLLIAFTRPIDTLVIGLADMDSEFSKSMLSIAENNPDFVEVIL